MIKIIETNLNRIVMSAIGVVVFLVVAYIDSTFKVDIFLRGEVWLILGGIFAGLYILQLMLFLVLSEKNEGWKRMSLVLGGVGGINGGAIGYDGFEFKVDDFFELISYSGVGIILGLSIIVIGRWIASGFNKA